jgi:hypothetical protein
MTIDSVVAFGQRHASILEPVAAGVQTQESCPRPRRDRLQGPLDPDGEAEQNNLAAEHIAGRLLQPERLEGIPASVVDRRQEHAPSLDLGQAFTDRPKSERDDRAPDYDCRISCVDRELNAWRRSKVTLSKWRPSSRARLQE